jgi:hypothetical protein
MRMFTAVLHKEDGMSVAECLEDQKRLSTEQQVNRAMHCPPWCADPRIEPGLPRRRTAGSSGWGHGTITES